MRNYTSTSLFRIVLLGLLLTFFSSTGQTSPNTIVAKTGDGIFSVLRKSGIHPIKYYEQFLVLNVDNIKNGSELIVGKEYILPDAPDSFRVTGTRIVVDTYVEEPIYDETQLSLLSVKDTSLQNSVYYFVHSGGADSKKRFDEVTNQLAKDLMVKGARVYVLENAVMDGYSSDSLSLAAKREVYGNYSSVINKKYLRHNGSYQRVILLEDNATKGQNTTLSVRHNAKSREGQQFASVLHEVLRKNAKVPGKVQKETNAFKDEASVYLANNLVPPVIILNFSDASDPKSPGFNLKAEKKPLAGLLNDGILQDYSHLNLEN